MKGVKRIIVVSVLVIVLTLLEAFMIKSIAGGQDKVKVYVATADINLGDKIGPTNTSLTEILKTQLSADHIKELGSESYATRPIYKSEQITQTNTSTEAPELVKSGYVHVGLAPEASNAVAWQIKKNDRVDINCFDENNKALDILDVRVVKVVDESFKEAFTEESIGNPKFLVVELTKKEAKALALVKKKGFYTVNKSGEAGL